MNTYRFGNIENADVYLDETNRRMAMNIRNNFSRLAEALAIEGKADSAINVVKKCMELLPNHRLSYDFYALTFAEASFISGDTGYGNTIFSDLISNMDEQLEYYLDFEGEQAEAFDMDIQKNMAILNHIRRVAARYKQKETGELAGNIYDKHYAYISGKR